jgi:hypothetical protein
MKLSENALGIEWLRQFDTRSVFLARLLIDSLKLVSLAEVERGINRTLVKVCSSATGTVALFTADKKTIDPSITLPGSEDRLGHLFRNIQRQFPERVMIRPTLEQMNTARVDHVVLVDDFVCSGQRIEDFWDVWASTSEPATEVRDGQTRRLTRKRGTLRSWLSFRYCNLWLVGYAVHEVGLERLLRRIPYLDEERVSFELTLRSTVHYWPAEVDAFIDESDKQQGSGGFGWGNLKVPLVFEYGCPDNCPKLLWRNGLSSRPLFPNRAIPPGLHSCFDNNEEYHRESSVLQAAGQPRLALAILREVDQSQKSRKYADILTLLGLLLRGYSVAKLSTALLRERSEIETLLGAAVQLGLLDDKFRITNFGRDIVARSRKSFLASVPSSDQSLPDAIYVPMQFQGKLCGARRKSSNEPEPEP